MEPSVSVTPINQPFRGFVLVVDDPAYWGGYEGPDRHPRHWFELGRFRALCPEATWKNMFDDRYGGGDPIVEATAALELVEMFRAEGCANTTLQYVCSPPSGDAPEWGRFVGYDIALEGPTESILQLGARFGMPAGPWHLWLNDKGLIASSSEAELALTASVKLEDGAPFRLWEVYDVDIAALR